MTEDLIVHVSAEDAGLMIKEIIYRRLKLSRGLLRRMKQGGGVFLNGTRAFITQRVKENDVISIYFHDSATDLPAEDIELDILWEDDSLVVVNKPPNMAVHPTGSYQSGTLANALAYYWQKQGLKRKIRLVHRLDRETSGAILVAKEPYAFHKLVQQLRRNDLTRKYLAICEGHIEHHSGVIDQPIKRAENDEDHGLKRVVDADGKPAKTKYEVIRTYYHDKEHKLTLAKLQLFSGRTHQIRVHLAWLGYPILADPIYSKPSSLINRQALHAWSLSFRHPRTGRTVNISVPLPGDMADILKYCKEGELG